MEGTPKAIEIKGICRNATKIGVQDGQAEDLINLRFMDGSWRASGDGRIIDFTMAREYSQLYVHTNIYHHLLGVYEGTLYWFAEIDKDGTSFYPLDGTTDRTQWPEDMQDLPTAPVALTQVVGDMWITQTGHLLTVIDENDDFEYLVFKTSTKEYKVIDVNANGNATDRNLYPFGQIHFNCYCPKDDAHKLKALEDGTQYEIVYQAMDVLVGATQKKNLFSQHFLVVAAFELYDGSFVYACNPVHLCPRENLQYIPESSKRIFSWSENDEEYTLQVDISGAIPGVPTGTSVSDPDKFQYVNVTLRRDDGIVTSGVSENTKLIPNIAYWMRSDETYQYGSDLVLNIDKNIIDMFDEDVFKSLCVFVTKESNIYPTVTSKQDFNNRKYQFDLVGPGKFTLLRWRSEKYVNGVYVETTNYGVAQGAYLDTPALLSTADAYRKKTDIIYDLLHSPFYLLRKYKKEELYALLQDPIVRLDDPEYKEILKTTNLVQQQTLPIEATGRTTYVPKVTYQYNGRLHIANYKSYPFFGYPIDLFHLHNHSVKVQTNSWFKGVLQNLTDNNDEYIQFEKDYLDFSEESVLINNREALIAAGAPYFIIKVYIETSNGEQVVTRYIPAYDPYSAPDHTANFIEALNPFLSYPDTRATKMEIYYFYNKTTDISSNTLWVYNYAAFELKPHPYLNIAYYIKPDLKPISIWNDLRGDSKTFTNPTAADMREFVKLQNTEEYLPNGLKVSKTDNPMFFPVENTYQVGSSEILALMSNTIPVGTGQTGDAPLYIFCKDGVYAAFVDASGEMVYPNTRPLAPDVCNNPRSVTKTDLGVVFTTDRGLMRMNGNEVEEIGATAEGNVLRYADLTTGNKEFIKAAHGALRKVADLPDVVSATDFLTYLKDKGTIGKAAIINYNHNLRELIVSNPNYPYSYVMDREGNWSRRDYTATEYVNNYPTSYRLTEDGEFYKLDEEGDDNTPLEERKEADNKIFYLSNVIKLDSIGFKQAYRFVVRGYFETQPAAEGATTEPHVGCYIFGSYDGRKWAMLGGNEKKGKFTDIGCLVERTDVRFFRVCLAGKVTGKTRIDYMEMSANGSVLNTKIR